LSSYGAFIASIRLDRALDPQMHEQKQTGTTYQERQVPEMQANQPTLGRRHL
jgi:hypothetical protein